MTRGIAANALRTALVLFVFAVLGTALLAQTFALTREEIARNEERARLKLINQIIPAALYDNDVLHDTLALAPSPSLGRQNVAYRVRKAGQPVAVLLETVAPDGYAGDIKLLVGIRVDGTISGVRVLSHMETPGLGDYIDIARSEWIRIFEGRSLSNPEERLWKVKKDGGGFDSVAGATITPRAVVRAVQLSLAYYAENRAALFSPLRDGKS